MESFRNIFKSRRPANVLYGTLTRVRWLLIAMITLGVVFGSFGMAENVASHSHPTMGPVPNSAFNGGQLNPNVMPDFVPASSHSGQIVGYVRKTDILPSHSSGSPNGIAPSPASLGAIPVYNKALTKIVGHMYPGVGFVPIGQNPTRTLSPTTTIAAP